MNNQPLNISYTDTEGYRRSLVDSPSWNPVFKVIESLIKKFNVKTMVEIGVARGHHSAHLLEAIPDLLVYSIDPWGYFPDEYDNMYSYHTLADDEKLYRQAAELLKPFGRRSNILRCTSSRATRLINETLNMVHLDGDHSYEGIKEDIKNWWGKLKVGGILSGNAYGHNAHPGVAKAVNEFINKKGLKLNLEISLVWWIMKLEEDKYIIENESIMPYNKIKPPLSVRLKRKIKRYLIIAPIKMKYLIRKIPGVRVAYLTIKKLWT